MIRATPPTMYRCFTTNRPHGTHPWPALDVRRRKPQLSSRGPIVARITGSRVVAISTLTSGISIPP